jgi:hypothetical protein
VISGSARTTGVPTGVFRSESYSSLICLSIGRRQ